MTASEAWWQLFTLTGNIEAYLLYRGIMEPDAPAPAANGKRYCGTTGVFYILEPDDSPPAATGPLGSGSPRQG